MMEHSELFNFVWSLFEGQGKHLSNEKISIEMDTEPWRLVVKLYDNKDKNIVEVSVNSTDMGYFECYKGQGLEYAFHQFGRKGMTKNTLTAAEGLLENTCKFHSDKIRIFRAYNR